MVDRGRNPTPPETAGTDLRAGVLAGALLLTLVASQSAPAAASVASGCDSVARALKSVAIPVEILSLDGVDHMPEDHGVVDPAIGHEHDPTAPLLFLTPRVAHILQDVFGDAEPAPAALTPMERVRRIMVAASAEAGAQAPQPPADAGSAGGDGEAPEISGPTVSSGPLTETFYDVDTLPRFQRRMYRNDI